MAEFDFAARIWCRRRGPWRAVVDEAAPQGCNQAAHGSGAALKNIGDESQRDHGEDELAM